LLYLHIHVIIFYPWQTTTSFEGISEGAYHYADIAPGEAAAINNSIDIVAYGCVHHVPAVGEGDPVQVDVAFQAAADMVAALNPERGDVLFTEAVRHNALPNPFRTFDPEARRSVLEDMRADRTIEPMFYAQELAALRGIPVVAADIHQDIATVFEEIIGESIPDVPCLSWPFQSIYFSLRNEQAANTVKDYARNALPTLGQQKPTYALLVGPGHIDQAYSNAVGSRSVVDAFDRMGLHVAVDMLPSAYDTAEQTLSEAITVSVLRGATHIAPLALSAALLESPK
jgi:hypothetical protein